MFPPSRFELFKLLLDIRLGIYWVIPKEPLLSQYSDQTKTSQIWVMRSVSHMPTRSLSHPALGLQRLFKVIGSNIEQQIIAHQRSCDAADDAKILTRKKAYFPSINLTSRHCHLFDLPIQQSNAFLSPYPIPQNIFFSKGHLFCFCFITLGKWRKGMIHFLIWIFGSPANRRRKLISC